jgi:hypothetical protein
MVVPVHEQTPPRRRLPPSSGRAAEGIQPVFTVRNSESEKVLSLLTLGLDKGLSTPAQVDTTSQVAVQAAFERHCQENAIRLSKSDSIALLRRSHLDTSEAIGGHREIP